MAKKPSNLSKRGIVTCPIDDVSVYLCTPEEVALKTALWDLMYGKNNLKKKTHSNKKQPDKVGTKRGGGGASKGEKEETVTCNKKRMETTPAQQPPPRKRMSSRVNYDALERFVRGGEGEKDGNGEEGKGRPVREEEEEQEEEEGGGGDGGAGNGGGRVFDGDDYLGSDDEGDYDNYYESY